MDDQQFEVRLDKPSWVVFSEVNYPGWKAWVDGVPQAITTSNYVFRGIGLKAGDHQVRFQFDPILVRLVFFGLCLWILSILAFRPWRKK